MTNPSTLRPRILLVEDNPADARLLRELLAEARHERFDIVHVDRVATALARLCDGEFDAMLLDLSLPDGVGLETVTRMLRQAPTIPIVVLTGLDDETLALRSVQAGAQDYLVKGQVTSQLLVRAIRYAIERRKSLEDQRHHAETEAAARRSHFLAEAGRMLSASLDTDTLVKTIGRVVVPDLGDLCLVDLVDDNGLIRRVVAGHGAGIDEDVALGMEAYPPDPAAVRSPAIEVIRSGRLLVLDTIDQTLLEGAARGAEELALWRRAAVKSAVIAPLTARGRVFGALLIVKQRAAHHYQTADRSLFEELAQHAAMALDNAQLYQKAQLASRARDEMVSVVSHDLRNPLNVITMSLALVRREPLSATLQRTVGRIERSVDQMLRLINDLLDVARIENGTLAVEIKAQPIESVLSAAVELMRPLAADRLVTLATQVSPNVPQALCDRDRIVQVLSNLVGNAIKFTPSGGHVEVAVDAVAKGVRVSVRDTGSGIARDQLDHVFDRFWQAKRADRQGAGLGLAIAKAIVEAHNGAIGVESELGSGACFYFVIPTASTDSTGSHQARAMLEG